MRMDAGLDTGPVVEIVDVPIAPDETPRRCTTSSPRPARRDRRRARPLAHDGRARVDAAAVRGRHLRAKVDPRDAAIDWSLSAVALDRRVRAFDPAPGALARFGGEAVKIRRALAISRDVDAAPGEVIARSAEGIDVACGPPAAKARCAARGAARGRQAHARRRVRGRPRHRARRALRAG
jgi:methionyl-tRNA formyltransferase